MKRRWKVNICLQTHLFVPNQNCTWGRIDVRGCGLATNAEDPYGADLLLMSLWFRSSNTPSKKNNWKIDENHDVQAMEKYLGSHFTTPRSLRSKLQSLWTACRWRWSRCFVPSILLSKMKETALKSTQQHDMLPQRPAPMIKVCSQVFTRGVSAQPWSQDWWDVKRIMKSQILGIDIYMIFLSAS